MQIEEPSPYSSPAIHKKISAISAASTDSSTNDENRNFRFCDTIVSEFPSFSDDLASKLGNMSFDWSDKRQKKADRFIPMRKVHSFEEHVSNGKENDQSTKGKEVRENKMSIEEMYRTVVLGEHNKKMLSFAPTKDDNQSDLTGTRMYGVIPTEHLVKKESSFRKISKTPFKVLDAPNLQDDFYLNLVDWSKQNVLGVALGSCIYLWDANTNKVCKFCDMAPQSTVTSVGWSPKGNHISIGNSVGDVEIWDVTKNKKLVSLYGHSARVTSIAWSSSILASGSRDKTILYRDIREDPKRIVNRITHHTQ